jgi:hypothetical protein
LPAIIWLVSICFILVTWLILKTSNYRFTLVGTKLSATDVTVYLNDCMTNSGHALVSDFRNLWPYSYVNKVRVQMFFLGKTNNLSWQDKMA